MATTENTTTTTYAGSISRYLGGGYATLADSVAGYLNEFCDDYDLDGLVRAVRDQINHALAGTGYALCGDDLYRTVGTDDDEDVDEVAAALASVDLDALAAEHEL